MLPITIKRRIKGANGRNWPGFVILDPDAKYPAAVWGQEAWEAMHKLNPVNLLRVRLSKSARRDFEVMGHEIEVQAARVVYGVNPAAYRAKEAATMKAGYSGLFRDWSETRIVSKMERRTAKAHRWVMKNRKRLEDFR